MSNSRGGELGSIDSRMLLYVPSWARRLAIGALGVMLGLSVAMCTYVLLFKPTLGHEVLLFGLSILQTSAAGLAFVIVLFYSRRDANMATLIAHSDEFLKKHVRSALERVSVPALGIDRFEVADAGAKDIFGHLFIMQAKQIRFPLWVGLNVHRLFVIYYLPRDAEENFAERAERIFQFTFGVARKAGFNTNFEEATVNGEPILSIWTTVETEPDLLTNPLHKLFWSQDVAMLTESFLRTALRSELKLSLRNMPAPL